MGRPTDTFDANTRRKTPSVRWELAHSIGLLSLVVVAVGGSVIVASGRFEIRHKAANLVPRGVYNFFEQRTSLPEGSNFGQRARNAVTAAAPQSETSYGRTQNFSIGDLEREVLRIQGEPTRRSGNIWYYGESQVTFLGGRVVGWTNVSSHPLLVE